jgi:lipopolysaccharide transport system permease protein
MIKKVYFPRLAIPVATILAGLVDFCLAFIVGLGLMFYYHYPLTITALWIIPLLLLALVTALGVGLWSSALNVQYRDIRYVIPFLTQIWLFATPIAYPSSLLGEPWHTIYGINPMAGVVEGFRWALLGSTKPSGTMLAISATAALLVLISGVFYFRRMEKTFADVV